MQFKTISKTQQVRDLLITGDKDYKTIAEIVGCDLSLVYATRKILFPEQGRKKYRKSKQKTLDRKLAKAVKAVKVQIPLLAAKLEEDAKMQQTTEAFFKDALVDNPAHYTVGGISTYEFIKAKQLSYELGNVVKYVTRSEFKGDPLRDLQKARWYLNAAIKQLGEGIWEKDNEAVKQFGESRG